MGEAGPARRVQTRGSAAFYACPGLSGLWRRGQGDRGDALVATFLHRARAIRREARFVQLVGARCRIVVDRPNHEATGHAQGGDRRSERVSVPEGFGGARIGAHRREDRHAGDRADAGAHARTQVRNWATIMGLFFRPGPLAWRWEGLQTGLLSGRGRDDWAPFRVVNLGAA